MKRHILMICTTTHKHKKWTISYLETIVSSGMTTNLVLAIEVRDIKGAAKNLQTVGLTDSIVYAILGYVWFIAFLS